MAGEASGAQVAQVARAVADVAGAVRTIDLKLREVGGSVEQLQAHQLTLDQRLAQLATDFNAFVQADRMQKALQLAETRVVKVRQELDTRYGHYRDVRRRATGILQAMDSALVTHDSIQATTEDVMVGTPGYWLAPALVALAGWVRDDRALAERAVVEAMRRDTHKTALFFALVLRRYRREQASAIWVKRYFSQQDPTALDRECMVVLDAVTNGGFGPVAQALTRVQLNGWITQLSGQAGFVAEQRERWQTALLNLTPPSSKRFTYLRKHSSAWPQLADRLARAELHDRVRSHFHDVFDGEIPMSPRLAEQVDAILENLVTNFDDEELPLRKQERELQLIIDHHGDRDEAATRFAAEIEVFEENVSFAALLTNAAMHREQAGASRATQRFAVALSHEWIVEAYDSVVASGRQGMPEVVPLTIDDWSVTTEGGEDEQRLLDAQTVVYEGRVEAARAAVKLSTGAWVALVAGAAVALLGLITAAGGSGGGGVFMLLLGMAGVGYWLLERKNLDKRRDAAEAAVRQAHATGAAILRACLAEVVDWRRAWAEADAQAEPARVELAAIAPDQHARSHDTDARGVMIA